MLGLVLAGSMVISMTSPVADAAAKMSLSKKKITITQGEKVTLKVKKATKKVKWSVTKGKKVIKLSKKKKASVVITGKKAGKAVVTAKAGKKKLTCKVTVKAANTDVQPTPAPTVAPEFESSEFHYDGLNRAWIDANIDPSKPVVAISFDDGPGGYSKFVDYGMQIQNSLKEYGAHATFFYIGAHIEHDEDSRNEVISAKEAGFEVANHSYDSNGLNKEDADIIKEKIQKTDALLKELTGYNNFLFRAPNVAYSDTMFAVIEKPFIDVSVWSNDYVNSTTKEDLVENVTKNLKDGDIINMHSVHEKTAQAVPEILKYCKDNGIQVVGVSELFAIKGKALMTGKKYNNAY